MLISILLENYSNNLYVHGGPDPLKGDSLRRYGRSGRDMGALFFSRYDRIGIKYAMGYAISRSPHKWALYIVKLNIPKDKIFNFTDPTHRKIAKEHLSNEEYNSWLSSIGSSGHLDWTKVDDELFEDMGFRAAYFQERPAGAISDDAIISVGVFNASDVEIVQKIPAKEAKEKFKNIYN